ncbi:hypothetical protein [Arthrobacter caoxuetaonis]|uniref:Uncharacterized protein n=1 Tax=Arthrobacter caoxuetaonis TaxID=2886935 RepID=A0A9X1MHF2_9MICC|nr:hypothetical protein [Arthrobacter caoxuetaonis]MCC3299315.1 hypothetical protein [Arthrobacter caoxuetaonis]USQ59192.1 hypothetical protein NF551_16545 [Arthrobacter caoxuetaonis]
MTHNPVRQPAGIPVGGQFAPTTKSEPTGVTLDFDAASGQQLTQQRIKDRDEIREILDSAEDPDSREMKQLDRLQQHLSIQLAADSIIKQFPGASSIVLRENEDGENQYDLLSVRDDAGNELAGREDNDWTRNEIAGPNSPQLDELCWALDTEDDGWAKGIGRITRDRYNGKTAEIDLVSAVDKVAPPRSIAAVEAAENYAASQERMEHLRKQTAMIQEINDHASMRLVAAGILDKYPDARRLKCSRDINSNGRLEVLAVLDADGNVVADPDFDTELNDVDLLGGNGPTVRTLVQCMDPDNLSWATMIGEVRSNRHQTYVDVDLYKAMNQEFPDDERLKDPRVRPLSPQNQSDLVTAAEFGLPKIEEAIAGAENSHHENWLKDLAERTGKALKP